MKENQKKTSVMGERQKMGKLVLLYETSVYNSFKYFDQTCNRNTYTTKKNDFKYKIICSLYWCNELCINVIIVQPI